MAALAVLRNGGAVGAFALVNKETTMPFSLSSYLFGVGTVVGALAFGFGGGVLLTKTAMKDTPVAETRVERVKRTDSPAAPQPVETVDTKAMPALPPPAAPAPPAAGPASPVQASTEPLKTESAKPIAEAEPTQQAVPAMAAESTPQTEAAKPAEQSTKSPERKMERQKRDAERKAKALAMARAKQRQFEELPGPSRPEYVFERSSRRALAFEREEPRFNALDIPLFGRSREFSPIDRED
jgi:type IV secretory pathway VirB10-like protein